MNMLRASVFSAVFLILIGFAVLQLGNEDKKLTRNHKLNGKQKWKTEKRAKNEKIRKEKEEKRQQQKKLQKQSETLNLRPQEKVFFNPVPRSSLNAAKEMNERRAANLDKFVESGKKVRLPDVIIVGEKKCGTKTLMTFLLEHPQICGFRQEVHFVNTGEIVKDLKALLGHYSSIKNNKSQFLIAKTGFALFKAYLPTVPQNKLKMIEEKYLTETFENWMNRVVFVDIVCDPVKRLLSDFQHYKAEHPNALKMNDHKFGNNSEFSEISFNQFVNTRIKKHINQTDIARSIIRTSTYKFPRTLLKSFHSQLIILDGGVLQKEPWKEMKRLKVKLNWKGFFYEGRFGRREDGFWCVKRDVHLNTKENLICMPESKGRSKHGKETISPANEKFLYKAYELSSRALGKATGRNFSWFEKF